MIAVLQKHKLIFVGVLLIILVSVILFGYSRINSRKVPTKGVFVMQDYKSLLFPI